MVISNSYGHRRFRCFSASRWSGFPKADWDASGQPVIGVRVYAALLSHNPGRQGRPSLLVLAPQPIEECHPEALAR